jgi:hypothetical protein
MAMRDPETDPEENLEITDHVDDAVIGRAFRWSAFGLIGIVIVVGVVVFFATRP